MFNFNPKIAITFTSLLVTASMVSVLVVNSQAAPMSGEVKGTSTTPETKTTNVGTFLNPKSSPNKPDSTPSATNATAETTSTVASILLGQSDTSDADEDTTPTPITDPVPEVETPVTPQEPTTPIPVPQPTFSIDIQEASATTLAVVGGIHQIIVPFNVVLETGFVITSTEQPLCNVLSGPANSNILCAVNQKDGASGTLSIQYTDATPVGRYVVEVRYSLNNTIRTDAYAFDLTATVPTIPTPPVVVVTAN